MKEEGNTVKIEVKALRFQTKLDVRIFPPRNNFESQSFLQVSLYGQTKRFLHLFLGSSHSWMNLKREVYRKASNGRPTAPTEPAVVEGKTGMKMK